MMILKSQFLDTVLNVCDKIGSLGKKVCHTLKENGCLIGKEERHLYDSQAEREAFFPLEYHSDRK